MNKGLKALLIVLLISLVGFSIIWGASWAFRVLMSLIGFDIKALFNDGFVLSEMVKSEPFSIISYTMNYAEVYPKQIKGAWALSGIVHAVLIAIMAWAIWGAKKKSLYGEARFASMNEIKNAGLLIPANKVNQDGLFAGTQIIVGKVGNQFIGLGKQLFAYLAAPTRSGKGVGVVIPVGLSYSDSMVVSDIKQELFEITGAFRAKNGHEVHLFNPFDPEGRTACWNPFSYVSRAEHLRVDDINEIAMCLIPDGGGDDNFFEESARKLFLGLGLYCLDKEAAWKAEGVKFTPTVKEILNLATDFSGDSIPYFQSLINDEFVTRLAKQTINSSVSAGDKTFASILATLTAALSPWLSSTVAEATSSDDFDLRNLRKKLMTIYIGIMPKDLDKASKIINLFYSQLINLNTAVLPQNDPALKYQCLMLMDEGTAPGRIKKLAQSVSYMAGYNLRLLLIVQSPAQMRDKALYGEHGTDNILTNIALKILFKPGSVKDSEEYSKLLGKTTIKEDTSKSRGGGSKGISRTETQNQRDLMMPQELRQMSSKKEIVDFSEMKYPIMADKIFYYEDKVFIKRFKNQGKLRAKSIGEKMNVSEAINASVRRAMTEDFSNMTTEVTEQAKILKEKILMRALSQFIVSSIVE